MTTIRPLPISRAPARREIFASFIARNAAILGCTPSGLITHCLGNNATFDGAGHLPAELTVQLECPDAFTSQLAQKFTLAPSAISKLFAKSQWPHLDRSELTATGGVNDSADTTTSLSDRIRLSWCPQCLLEDRAGGGDHFLRLEWALTGATMCAQHMRPLNGQCSSCFAYSEMPECALYGTQIAFICPTCGAPLDGQLGIDCVAPTRVREMLTCPTTQSLWRSIIRYEQFLISTPGNHRHNSKKRKMAQIIKSLADMLLHASLGSSFRPLDCFDNRYFNAPQKLGFASRSLREPFPVAHLVERRKALVVIIATLEDSFEWFGFGPHHALAHHCRDAMTPENYNAFERKLFDLARLALPF